MHCAYAILLVIIWYCAPIFLIIRFHPKNKTIAAIRKRGPRWIVHSDGSRTNFH